MQHFVTQASYASPTITYRQRNTAANHKLSAAYSAITIIYLSHHNSSATHSAIMQVTIPGAIPWLVHRKMAFASRYLCFKNKYKLAATAAKMFTSGYYV